MAAIIFRLNNVPPDEADEVRSLLNEHQLDFYETSGGNWGASMPAIWIKDDRQKKRARQLIDQYQQQRSQEARSRYQQLKQSGQHLTFLDVLRNNPFKLVIYFSAIAFILYLSFKLVFELAN